MNNHRLNGRHKGKEMEKEMENKQMVRIKLINGESFTFFGDEAVKAWQEWRGSSGFYTMGRGDTTFTIYEENVLYLERKGFKND